MLKLVIVASYSQNISVPIAIKIPPTRDSQIVTLLIDDSQNMAIIKLPDISTLSMLSEHFVHCYIVDYAFLIIEWEDNLDIKKDIVDKKLHIETF